MEKASVVWNGRRTQVLIVAAVLALGVWPSGAMAQLAVITPAGGWDFGTVEVGQSSLATFSILSDLDVSLLVFIFGIVEDPGDAFAITDVTAPPGVDIIFVDPHYGNFRLEVGEQVDIEVAFAPPAPGSYVGTFLFMTNGHVTPIRELPLSGQGTVVPEPGGLGLVGLALLAARRKRR